MARRRRPPRPGALADLSPSRILKQIALLQVFYYGVAIVLIVFTTFVAGRHPDTKAILDWRELRGDVTTGWTLALCWLLGSLITYVVDRPFSPFVASLTNPPPQSHTHPPSNRPLQTRPRFRSDDPLHPPDRHLSLRARHSRHALLVARASRFGRSDGFAGNVGLPVERAATHGVRRQGQSKSAGRG